MTPRRRTSSKQIRQGILNLCAINAKMDDSHKFYITPNFIKNQLNIGHIRSVKRALEHNELAVLIEDTNMMELGFPSFLHGEPSPKHPQFELFQKAKSYNLRFTGKAFKRNEQGQLLFIVEAMQSISDNIPTTKVLLDESFSRKTLEQQAIAVIQKPEILGMIHSSYKYGMIYSSYKYNEFYYWDQASIKEKRAKELPSLYNVVKKIALLSDSNSRISPISEYLLVPNSSGVLNGRIKGHYIYFLVYDEEVVYIGYSSNINRITAHRSSKSFNKVYYVLYDESNSYPPSLESFLIHRFKTKYNRCHIAQKMGYHKIN